MRNQSKETDWFRICLCAYDDLYCLSPTLMTGSPLTVRKIETLLWAEIRRRFRSVQAAAEQAGTECALEGSLTQTRLKIAEGHFAMGLSTDEPVRFQGFHAENLLVVLDEACGVPEEIWDAVEGICVGRNNRVLAISNPLAPTGRFYHLFSTPRWKTVTISALMHPNVRERRGGRRRREPEIAGAVTREAVCDRIAEWCEPVDEGSESEPAPADTFLWEGRRYRPNGLFRARVLGEFPESAEDSLFSLTWIEMAMGGVRPPGAGDTDGGTTETGAQTESRNPPGSRGSSDAETPCVVAVDVARFGADETVFAARRGSRVTRLFAAQGWDTMAVAGRAKALAQEERADFVVVDAIGIGAGVVDRLAEENVAGLIAANFASKPFPIDGAERYLNLRAQTYWTLRDRLRQGDIRLPADAKLSAQLTGLRYLYTPTGQIQIESKDALRGRGLPSPDRADAVALLFVPQTAEHFCGGTARVEDTLQTQAAPISWLNPQTW